MTDSSPQPDQDRPDEFCRTTDQGGMPKDESAPVGVGGGKIAADISTRRGYPVNRFKPRIKIGDAPYLIVHRPSRRIYRSGKKHSSDSEVWKKRAEGVEIRVSIPVSVLQEVFPTHNFYKSGISIFGSATLHLPSNSVIFIFDSTKETRLIHDTVLRYIKDENGVVSIPIYSVNVGNLVTSRPVQDVFVYDYLPIPEANSLVFRWPCRLVDPVSGTPRLTQERSRCWPEEFKTVSSMFEARRWKPGKKGPLFDWTRNVDPREFLYIDVNARLFHRTRFDRNAHITCFKPSTTVVKVPITIYENRTARKC